MRWTERQKEVIEQKGSDLLVAAAAGSGKTAVLVERILKLIIEDGVPIDKFLVVTFTRAAASEMKEKIIDAITLAATETPEKSAMLRRQLDKVNTSSISTFDSFAMDIVRNYFYVIDIDPNLQVASDEDATLLKDEAMNEVFEKIYTDEDPETIAYVDAFSSYKNDADLKYKLLKIYDSIMALPQGLDWLSESIDSMESSGDELSPVENKIRDYISHRAKADFNSARELLISFKEAALEYGLEKFAAKFDKDIEFAAGLQDASLDEIPEMIKAFKFTQLRTTKAEEDTYNQVKDEIKPLFDAGKTKIKDIGEKFFSFPLNEQFEDVRKTIPFLRAMLGILREFDELYSQKKLRRGLMDFSDGNHFAIKILRDENVAAEIRDKYDYIFVDEYQDSNYLQEAIISAIKRPDNLFMVGDIKQSIYSFRLAEPDIFKQRYRVYKEPETEGEKIDLNSNFRSKASVIDTVNDIFKDLMDDYDEDAMLYRGDSYEGEINHKSELHIIDCLNEEEPEDDVLQDYKNVELEALLVADLVRQNLGKEIYDSKKGIVRPLEKRDIVILLRSAKNRAVKYYDALMNAGIDAYIDDNSGYFNTIEISSFLDVLRLIDNRRQDIPLLSVLRMPVFDFSIEDMIKVRLINKDVPYHEAFIEYGTSDREDLDEKLKDKVKTVLDFLDRWSDKQSYTPVDKLVWQLMKETGYYNYAGALPSGNRRQANLRNFVAKAAKYAGGQWSSLHGLIAYIEAAKDKIDDGQAVLSSEGDNTVRIMTVHKSKGLEFPLVIVAGMGNVIKGVTQYREGIWHKDLGFGMNYINREEKTRRSTILEKVIADMKNKESIDEEIRIFYVACTRAKEKLIMVGCDDNWEKTQGKLLPGIKNEKNYLQMVAPVIDEQYTKTIVHSRNELSEFIGEETERENRVNNIHELENYALSHKGEEVADRLAYVYPHSEDVDRKSKYSVTELNAGEERKYDFRVPAFVSGQKKITGASLGTVMHSLMEHLDFNEVGRIINEKEETLAYIDQCINDMVDSNLLTKDEGDSVRKDQILGFFESEIGRRALNSDYLEKEKHFTILHEQDGKEIIVQGVIDCFFEEEGKLILVDYKTNYNTEGIEELYRDQMLLYKEALEKSTGKEVAETHLYLFKYGRSAKI